MGIKESWNHPNRETSAGKGQTSDTVYHMLCQSKRTASVIGKGGSIIKSLREETQAKITVADSVPGSDERVIIISSPSKKLAGRTNSDNKKENQVTREVTEDMELHCAAQVAHVKVHNRIVEEDLGGGAVENNKEIEVTTRLLVANYLVGCLLGKKEMLFRDCRVTLGQAFVFFLLIISQATDVLVQVFLSLF